MADIVNKVLLSNGKIAQGQGGAGYALPHPSAPNGVNLGETVSIDVVDVENERDVTITFPTADYSAYSKVIFYWRGKNADGVQLTTSFAMTPASGTTSYKESVVLGALMGYDPQYEMCIVDTSGRMGYSLGLRTPGVTSFSIVSPPALTGTFVEGSTMTPVDATYSGGNGVAVVSSYLVAKDNVGTDSQTEVVVANEVPDIANGFDYIAYKQDFTGTGDNLPFSVQSDWYEIIDSVSPPGDPPIYLGGLITLNLEAGQAYSVDWDTYFSGATSYLVVSGLTGGVSSNGSSVNDIYTVASLTGEQVTVSVTATNANGSTNRSFNVNVTTPGVAPSLASAVPDFIVPRGSTIDYNVAQHFNGTALTYYSVEDDSNFALDSAGRYKSLVPLTSAIGSASKVFVAYNNVGTTLGTNPITTTNGSPNVVVAWSGHSIVANDWVGITGASATGGITLNGAYKVVSVVAGTSITVNARTNASSGATGGGAAVKAQKAAWDTVTVEVTQTPNAALTVDEVNIRKSNYRYGTTWRTPETRLPGGITLANNPLSTTNGSAVVSVTLEDHKLVITDQVVLTGATAVGGLTLSGTYTVSDVVDEDTFKITASGNATSTATGGGSVVVYTRPQTTATLGTNPFSFINASSTVIVTWTAHPVGVGRVVEFTGATTAANLIISGAYLVISVPTANTFTIDAGSTANATTTGGGAAVVATLRNHNQPLFLGTNPLTTTDSSAVVSVNAPNHMLAVGRPFILSGASAVGGIIAGNLNGSRTVLAVTDTNTFTFTAGASASSTAGGGGTGNVIKPRWEAIRWTRSAPDSNGVVPDNQSEETPLAWQETTYGRWEPHMELLANEGNPTNQTPTRLDYSVWNAENPSQIKVAYKETPTSLWSTWTGQVAVPAIEAVITATSWLPISSRNKNSYEANDPESRGQQFDRVVAWYQGTDAERVNWVLAGQDENSCWVSKDQGYSWKGINIPGMTCSSMSGIYWDDDCAVFAGDAFGKGGGVGATWQNRAPFSGLFVGPPDLSKSTRLELTRPSNTYGYTKPGGGGVKQAFVTIQHGNTHRAAQNCMARRPQTGGLTLAQRPIWVAEQAVAETGGTVSAIYMWKIILSGTGTVASATMIRSLTPATYGAGDACINFVRVAPNGDIMLVTQKGVFVSTDDFGSDPTQKFSRKTLQGFFVGGTASTSSGAFCGDNTTSPGGVYYTANINTTAFARPTGAGGVANAGLPASFNVTGLGYNGSVLVTNAAAKGVHKSVDMGKNFSAVTQVYRPPSATENWRYSVGGDPTAVYPSPNDSDIWVIHAAQCLMRSTNNFQTMDPKGTVFCDGVHDKGWAFGATAPSKMARLVQDNWANTSLDGVNWLQRNDITSSGNDALRTAIQAAGGGSSSNGYITAGQGLFVESNNRVIGGITNDGASFNCVLYQITGRNGTYGQYDSGSIISPSGTSSRCQRSDWSPLNDGRGFVGRWCVSNTTGAAGSITVADRTREFIGAALSGANLTLGNNPIATSNGTANVVVTYNNHGLLAGQSITLAGLTATGGIAVGNLNGARTISSATTNTFTITAGANASSSATGGGNSATTTKALVSFWGNYNYNSGTTVYRSIEPDGSDQVLWHTMATGTSYVARSIEIDRFHPTLNRLLFVHSASKSIIKEMVKSGGSVTITTLTDILEQTNGARDILEAKLGSGVFIPPYEITGLLSDYNKPGLFYSYGGHHGHPNWFMTTNNGVTWSSISDGIPSSQWRGRVVPLTGDVIGSCSLGGHVFPPVSDYPAVTYRGYYSNQLKTFYDKPTVPNPPLG